MTSLKKGSWQISDASIGLGVGLFCFALIVVPLVYEFNKDQQYSTAASHALRVEKATQKYMMYVGSPMSCLFRSGRKSTTEFSK